MDLAIEMQALMKVEVALLLSRCEKQMRLMSTLVAVVIVIAVFIFLVGAYSPMFMMGGVV